MKIGSSNIPDFRLWRAPVDIFIRLKMAMQLNAMLQRHQRAMTISRDSERSGFDKIKGHEKHLMAMYRSSTWCVHIKRAFNQKQLPNQFVIRYANLLCNECTIKVDQCIDGNLNGMKKNLVAVQSHLVKQLVDLYSKDNIDIYKNTVYTAQDLKCL